MRGRKNFVTTLNTLTKRENMIKVMMNSDFKIDRDENGAILFKDRNPDYFPLILEHLRTGKFSTRKVSIRNEEWFSYEINVHNLTLLSLFL